MPRISPTSSSTGTPINQTLVNDLAGGGFIAQQRNVVLVGGTGTGKTHLALAIARSCIRSGARGRFFNVVDLVNRLETETRSGRQGRLAEHLTHHCDIVETGNDSWRFKSRDDDHITRARLASAIPTSSDETSATAKPRRPKGSKLDADEGSNLQAD